MSVNIKIKYLFPFNKGYFPVFDSFIHVALVPFSQ